MPEETPVTLQAMKDKMAQNFTPENVMTAIRNVVATRDAEQTAKLDAFRAKLVEKQVLSR